MILSLAAARQPMWNLSRAADWYGPVRGQHHVAVSIAPDDALHRVSVRVVNTGAPAADKDDAIARSLIGAHIIAEAIGGESSRSSSHRHRPPTRCPDAPGIGVSRCWPARPEPGICC